MKNYLFLMLVVLFMASACSQQAEYEIRINQLGYYPNAVKKAVIVGEKAISFQVIANGDKVVFEGKLTEPKIWDKSGELLQVADFSEFTREGEFQIKVAKKFSSSFVIQPALYRKALKASVRSYYYCRASTDLPQVYAGKYSRKAGHTDTLCYFHPSAGRSEKSASSSKGWYDAGDCNKYVVNGGVTVGTLMNFHEMYPNAIADGYSNIPESNNGKSDLLDEIKYELDWMLTMQAPDGASHFKLTSKGFTGFIMPEQDTTQRYIVGKSTTSTLNFAAAMAQASRLFQNYDSAYAKQCLSGAVRAWKWAEANPALVFKNPKDIQTGEYGDSTYVEEFWWAAAELWLATQDSVYATYLTSNEAYVKMEVGESWRKFLGNIGSFSMLLAKQNTKSLDLKLDKSVLDVADELLKKKETIPYGIAVDDFQWGSNSDILNTAIVYAYAYRISEDVKYLDAAVQAADYIFGVNATGYSFVTGFGSKYSRHLHNRPMSADGIDEPISGFLAGGANNNREDDIKYGEYGVKYPDTFPAKSYVDLQGSYASNENAINWNAPLVFVLGFLEENVK